MSLSVIVMSILAGAGDPAPGTSAATTAAPERRICRVQERLGTILPRRVCRSASDWALIDGAQDKITTRDTNHMRNRRMDNLCNNERPC
jgi:hypothetical protein